MATITCVLVAKATHAAIYRGQHFIFDDTIQSTPTGLLGGEGQKDWYWCNITAESQATKDGIADGSLTTRTPPGGEAIPAYSVDENGVETGKNHVVSGGTWA